MKMFFGEKGEGDFFSSTEVGGTYYYPSVDGRALIVQVMGKGVNSLIVKIGDLRVYVDKEYWNKFGIPYNKRIKLIDCLQDEDNKLVFVRYKFVSSLIDRVYNWYVDKIKKPL